MIYNVYYDNEKMSFFYSEDEAQNEVYSLCEVLIEKQVSKYGINEDVCFDDFIIEKTDLNGKFLEQIPVTSIDEKEIKVMEIFEINSRKNKSMFA